MYLMTTDDHFELASYPGVASEPVCEKAARNLAPYTSELGEMGRHEKKEPLEIPLNSEGF